MCPWCCHQHTQDSPRRHWPGQVVRTCLKCGASWVVKQETKNRVPAATK